ncbi:ABC transporter substrate-binding protein [Pseudomonas vanderleydeniana]|uniref:ABC transporter substrate-binding protein n=1 Tax=Pseudomonas vanderleydeniana TaxID=2745495 RepID=A0A9E6PH94_9PSED|nr:ABC transporter substrate-binding protein [Pseudomonas vanderleydeniana]QXI26375.1 ABC transporter substrate-binding protein [Pseudomonas vanderleydeniana]
MSKKHLLALALMIGAAGAQAADNGLRIGIEAAYPPFAYKQANGELAGFDYDIGNALCKQMEVKCIWVEQEYDGLIPSLKVRKVDAILASLTITEDRKKSVDFTDRYYRSAARLVMKQDLQLGSDLSGLAGKRIGVQRASIHDRYATQVLEPKGAVVVRYTSQNEVYLDLQAQRLDGTLADDVILDQTFLKKPIGKGFAFSGPAFNDPAYFGDGVAIAVRKGDQPLAERFNRAIAEIRANGTYQQINSKYFDFNVYGE